MAIKNEVAWEAIENLPPFQRSDCPSYERCWQWLQKLQKTNYLRTSDIFKLQGLIEAVYQSGVDADR